MCDASDVIAEKRVNIETGSYSRDTLIDSACFLGTFEVPKSYMEDAAKALYGDNRRFHIPENIEFKLFLVGLSHLFLSATAPLVPIKGLLMLYDCIIRKRNYRISNSSLFIVLAGSE